MLVTHGSIFAGIGGFDLGFRRAGMSCRRPMEAIRGIAATIGDWLWGVEF